MDTRIPTPILDLLSDYLNFLENELPGFVTGLYLHGSIALSAFDEDLSDIDFIGLLSRRASAADFDSLQIVHQTIATTYPR